MHEISVLLSEGGGVGRGVKKCDKYALIRLHATCKIVTERICHTCLTYHAFESCSNSIEFMYVTHVESHFRDINGPTEFLICIFLSS